MSKKLRIFTILLPIIAASIISSPVFATVQDGVDSARGNQQPLTLFGNAGIFSDITNVLLFVIGAIAVIMIVIGGLRYVISGGDAKQVQAAKNTILYALVGVVIAILAYALVNFVSTTFTNNNSGSDLNSSGSSSSGSSVK
jgi:Flp pilus assembly pilin Flp